MVLNSNILPYLFVLLGFLVVDLFCDGQEKIKNPWQINNAQNGSNSRILQSDKSTTPWPFLNQRGNSLPTKSHIRQQPAWVQNGSNWVRNSAVPSQVTLPNLNLATPAAVPKNPWQTRQQTMNTNNMLPNFVSSSSQRAPISSQNVMNLDSHSSQGLPVKFVTTPKSFSNNNRNNINVNFINNERTNIPGTQPLVSNQNKVSDKNKNNGETFSLGPLKRKDNTTYSTPISKTQSDGDVNDDELRDFSEVLLGKDTNNAAKYVTVNLQKMTSSRSTVDEAPLPLLTVDQAAFSLSSSSKIMQLYNNYILETNQNEVYTAQEKIEENDFLEAIVPTAVMQHTRNFLIEKGKIGRDPKEFKDLLRAIWFNMYSRGGGRIGSSGFEHVFLAELKSGKVSGLHNWLYFNEEEKKNNVNYLGYMKQIDLGNKGAILKYHFLFHGVDKPVGSMFIGTSPEFEMALYTTCYVLRADRICPLKLNGKRFIIRTYTFRYRGKNMIGSAFPEI